MEFTKLDRSAFSGYSKENFYAQLAPHLSTFDPYEFKHSKFITTAQRQRKQIKLATRMDLQHRGGFTYIFQEEPSISQCNVKLIIKDASYGVISAEEMVRIAVKKLTAEV